MSRPAGLVFDLDGTLLDSLADLAEATNTVLRQAGYPTHPTSAYRTMIGRGLRMLLKAAFPTGVPDVEAYVGEWERAYTATGMVHTVPYDGVLALLDGLDVRAMPCAVLTNKPHDAATALVADRLGPRFAGVYGAVDAQPLKPDPESVHRVLRDLGWSSAWLVGDSDVDIQTARAAGVRAIGCLWGFRSREELVENGADVLLDQPQDLLCLIDGA